MCRYKDPGTHFAPCSTDSDCFSSFCDQTGKPGPYCYVAGGRHVDNLRGFTCNTDGDCNKVLSADDIKRGIYGTCFAPTSLDPKVCAFYCKY
jgi:hypothetical protein